MDHTVQRLPLSHSLDLDSAEILTTAPQIPTSSSLCTRGNAAESSLSSSAAPEPQHSMMSTRPRSSETPPVAFGLCMPTHLPLRAEAISRRPRPSPMQPTPTRPSLASPPTRLQLTRLRLHLLQRARQQTTDDNDTAKPPARRRPHYTDEERRARAHRLRQRWADPEWRAAMLARRRQADTLRKLSEATKRLWQDPVYRERMRQARLGRVAVNKGVSPSAVTRLRMSVARKGVTLSDTTRKRMSQAKLQRPEGDDWPKRISESKRGKTKEYFQMRREFRALHHDLKLWSDSYRSKYGRLPSASTCEQSVAPMMIFRIKRYLTLREAIGSDDPELRRDIISRE